MYKPISNVKQFVSSVCEIQENGRKRKTVSMPRIEGRVWDGDTHASPNPKILDV